MSLCELKQNFLNKILVIVLLLELFSSVNSLPAETNQFLSCLNGPNFDPELDESSLPERSLCNRGQTVCLRLEAEMFHLNDENVEGE